MPRWLCAHRGGERKSAGDDAVNKGAVPWLLLSPVSGCSLMLLVALRFGLLGAVCCFASTASVCVGCFLLFPASLGLVRVLPFCVVGPARGPAFRLGAYLLWFPAIFCASTPIPIIASPCNTCIEEEN